MEAGTRVEPRGYSGSDLPRRVAAAVVGAPVALKAAVFLLLLMALPIAAEQGLDGLLLKGVSALEAAALIAAYLAGIAAITYARHPALAGAVSIAELLVVLVVYNGLHDTAQASLNGLSLGSVIALGAIGLTLIYGILKLVNFAHGDFLTFGAYMAYLATVTLDLPLLVGIVWAMVATALLGVFFEKVMWGPMRARKAGLLQLLLMAIGLALVIRAVIQFIWSTDVRLLDINVTKTVEFLGVSVGRTALIVIVVGFVVLTAVGLLLRYSLLGKQMRALSDNLDLAETTGINTERVVLLTWVFAGALAGLAGVLASTSLTVYPELGFELLLAIFAAVVIGGIGSSFGALAGGIVLGLVIEWSTLLVDARWKLTFGFAVLILVLIIRPQGIFGRARTL